MREKDARPPFLKPGSTLLIICGAQSMAGRQVRHVLAEDNTVYVPDFAPQGESFASVAEKAQTAAIFLTSANAVSENGEIINIDGCGNRLAGVCHEASGRICGSMSVHLGKPGASPAEVILINEDIGF